MKKVIIIISLLFACAIALLIVFLPKFMDINNDQTGSSYSGPKNYITADDFTVYDSNGKEVRLSDFVGKPTVVNFWATWCGYCVKELPDFEKKYQEYGNDVNFLMVDMADGSRETKKDALDFKREHAYTFPVYFDSDFSATEAYSIRSIPMTLILDKEGNLIKTQYGTMDGNDLKFYLDKMLDKE